MAQKPLEPVCGRRLENFGDAGWRSFRMLFKWSLMGNSCGNLEDQNVDSKDCAPGISGVNKDVTWNWSRGHSCYILTKNLFIFCSCLET